MKLKKNQEKKRKGKKENRRLKTEEIERTKK